MTRDIDVAVSVARDPQAEDLVLRLRSAGFAVLTALEQRAAHRLVTVRLAAPGEDARGVVVDLLFASSGIEAELVARAERIEVLPGLTVPVARIGHLVALKVLARDDRRRPQDIDDLRALLREAEAADVDEARAALATIGRGASPASVDSSTRSRSCCANEAQGTAEGASLPGRDAHLRDGRAPPPDTDALLPEARVALPERVAHEPGSDAYLPERRAFLPETNVHPAWRDASLPHAGTKPADGRAFLPGTVTYLPEGRACTPGTCAYPADERLPLPQSRADAADSRASHAQRDVREAERCAPPPDGHALPTRRGVVDAESRPYPAEGRPLRAQGHVSPT